MSLITNNSTPAERSRGLVFSELFENAEKIVQNEGVITGAPVINNGATFDGTNDWITYDSPPFSTVVSGNSFSAVIDFDITVDHGALQCLVEWGPGTAADSVMVLLDTDNYLRLYVGNGVSIFTGTAVTSGRHTLTAYWDGSNRDMYLDGASVGKTSPGATGVTTVGTKIGARLDNSLPLNGTIYSAKVFKTELTLQEHTDYYNNATYRYINEAVLDLPMGMAEHDPTNTRTLDLSVTANHPTWTGSAEPVKLTDKHGYTFDGVDDYLEVAHNANQLLTGGMTISAWIRPVSGGEGATSNGGRIVDKSTNTNAVGGFRFNVANSTNTLRFQVNNGTEIASDTNFDRDSGMWQHVAVTVASDATTTFYIDGVVSGTPGVTGALSGITTTTAMRIGNRAGSDDRTFDGDIARLKIWDSDLTALQVKDLYQREFKKINVT